MRLLLRLLSLIGAAVAIAWGVLIVMATTPKDQALANVSSYLDDLAWLANPALLWVCAVLLIACSVALWFTFQEKPADVVGVEQRHLKDEQGPRREEIRQPNRVEPNMPLLEVVKRITRLANLPRSNEPDSGLVLHALEVIRERALLDHVAAWGGIHWRTTRPADYDRMVRDAIPAAYWRNHRIDTIGFLDPDDKYRGFTCDLTGRRDPHDYYGIWFDREQVALQWPAEAAQLKHDAWLKDAIRYIVTRDWNQKLRVGGPNLSAISDAMDVVRQLAADGDFRIWGSPDFSGPLELIDPKYWVHYGFDQLGFFRDDPPEEFTTEPKQQGWPHGGVRRRLKVSRGEVERRWPSHG